MQTEMKVRKTNRRQFEILYKFMAENTIFAKNIEIKTSQGRLRSAQLWGRLTKKLNAAGPPIKDEKAWRKVWVDRKHHMKKMMSPNKKLLRKSAARLRNIKQLSSDEEAVSTAGEIDTMVGDIVADRFGINVSSDSSRSEMRRTASPKLNIVTEHDDSGKDSEKWMYSTIDGMPASELPESAGGCSTSDRKFTNKINKTALFHQSLNAHKEFCDDIKKYINALLEVEKENLKVSNENQMIFKEILELKRKKMELLEMKMQRKEEFERETLRLKRQELEIMKFANDLKSIELENKN